MSFGGEFRMIVDMEETDDGVWAIYFNTVLLATLDERDFVIRG